MTLHTPHREPKVYLTTHLTTTSPPTSPPNLPPTQPPNLPTHHPSHHPAYHLLGPCTTHLTISTRTPHHPNSDTAPPTSPSQLHTTHFTISHIDFPHHLVGDQTPMKMTSNIRKDTLPVLNTTIPAPPPITLPGPTLDSMNNYVKAFAPPHGYLISIGRSSLVQKPFCNYRSHRGGLPEASKDPTKESKSLKMECPFNLKARYSPSTQMWTLSHIVTNHNHDPNFDIQRQPTAQTSSNPSEIDVNTFLRSLGSKIKA
ncbi:uncharacterized protein MELLADRAFT_66869 [Melampsora larici-populina 98AG31]|uniref:FAR1 domain-containing protein n=1 Tax=Melampsora larici-populina (strain 98AG31 / pathotype 3-4-7) TaxID=747676 RepID=F4S0X8_MELLP|nr:uncharacterized protein MELLADRAFT_66869 [Melampsora larici-populina 98AG31]EGG01665.1 hypothetical protein MELLADRAFT_66869 [Melampsora larici-populina 98AG31]